MTGLDGMGSAMASPSAGMLRTPAAGDTNNAGGAPMPFKMNLYYPDDDVGQQMNFNMASGGGMSGAMSVPVSAPVLPGSQMTTANRPIRPRGA